jgi:hypothetical protein
MAVIHEFDRRTPGRKSVPEPVLEWAGEVLIEEKMHDSDKFLENL